MFTKLSEQIKIEQKSKYIIFLLNSANKKQKRITNIQELTKRHTSALITDRAQHCSVKGSNEAQLFFFVRIQMFSMLESYADMGQIVHDVSKYIMPFKCFFFVF